MNLEGLEVFVEVVQAGSLTAAARKLGRPVTTVSDKINQLEKRYGVTLLQRTTRSINLTNHGRALFEASLKAFEPIDFFQQNLKETQNEPQGLIRMTTATDVAQTLMPSVIVGFTEKYPKVKVELIATNERINLIKENVDLAIRIGALPDSTYRVRKWMQANASFWLTPEMKFKMKNVKSPTELKDYPFIKFKKQSTKNLKLIHKNQSLKLNLNSRIEVDDFLTLKNIVLESKGFGLMPDFICEHEMKQGRLVKIFPDIIWDVIHLSFVYPQQKYVLPEVKLFIEYAISDLTFRKSLE